MLKAINAAKIFLLGGERVLIAMLNASFPVFLIYFLNYFHFIEGKF